LQHINIGKLQSFKAEHIVAAQLHTGEDRGARQHELDATEVGQLAVVAGRIGSFQVLA
jgi:hypothetical protein